MFWKLARSALFKMDAEKAHHLTLRLLKTFPLIKRSHSTREHMICGLRFPNALGLAAGLDKNAQCLMAWQNLGFGFVEVGTVTALPQSGNAKPRLFRLPHQRALFNRMGFNNDGAVVVANRIEGQRARNKITIPIGINIGKSAVVAIEEAAPDYLNSFKTLADVADYVAINVSSPNTKNLRQLQSAMALSQILDIVASENARRSSPRPLFVKIAPDLSHEDALDCARSALNSGAHGLIISNTTTRPLGGTTLPAGGGGLSGAPLFDESTQMLAMLRRELGAEAILIGSGGVMSPADAVAKFNEGANLVQVYTGFVYGGPRFPLACAKAIDDAGI